MVEEKQKNRLRTCSAARQNVQRAVRLAVPQEKAAVVVVKRTTHAKRPVRKQLQSRKS